jgi:hypothetical protein
MIRSLSLAALLLAAGPFSSDNGIPGPPGGVGATGLTGASGQATQVVGHLLTTLSGGTATIGCIPAPGTLVAGHSGAMVTVLTAGTGSGNITWTLTDYGDGGNTYVECTATLAATSAAGAYVLSCGSPSAAQVVTGDKVCWTAADTSATVNSAIVQGYYGP